MNRIQRPASDELIERFARMTHSPRGLYASGNETYLQLLERLPKDDRPVSVCGSKIDVKHDWRKAAGIALIAGIGLAFAGVYTYHYYAATEADSEISVPTVTPTLVQTLEFVDTPLSDIVESLNEAYGLRIVIASAELADYRMTATFSTEEPIEDVLSVLCEAGGFSYVQSGSDYILTLP